MLERLLRQIFPWIIKKVFLLPLVERMFPFITNPVAKLLTGISLRYLYYQFSTMLNENVLDKYCDVIYAEYISLQTIMLCEYKNMVEWGMRYFIDFVNEVIKEATTNDSIELMINRMSTQIREEIRVLREEMNARFDLLENPSSAWQRMLTAEDLTHE